MYYYWNGIHVGSIGHERLVPLSPTRRNPIDHCTFVQRERHSYFKSRNALGRFRDSASAPDGRRTKAKGEQARERASTSFPPVIDNL
jgi:hypothetical protein